MRQTQFAWAGNEEIIKFNCLLIVWFHIKIDSAKNLQLNLQN